MPPRMTEEDLAHEERVVWLENTESLDYVRQMLDRSPRRRSRLRHTRDGRMVGFAVLGADASPDPCSGLFRRRVFFLLPHDRDSRPDGVYRDAAPEEAVDPRTVTAGSLGRKTPRSQRATAHRHREHPVTRTGAGQEGVPCDGHGRERQWREEGGHTGTALRQ